MASPSRLTWCLVLVLGHLARFTAAKWYIQNPSTGGLYKPDVPSCLAVITEAFDGWEQRTVVVESNKWIRWGRELCVLEVWNQNSLTFSALGSDLAEAFVQTMMATVATGDHYGGTSEWRSSNGNPKLYVQHSSAFGGDVGYPYKRDPDVGLVVNTTGSPADPATNAFAAHVAAIDFDRFATESEQPESAEGATAAGARFITPSTSSPWMQRRADGTVDSRAANKGVRLHNCQESKHGLADTETECECYDADNDKERGRFTVTCTSEKSGSKQWTQGKLSDALSALRTRVADLHNGGWGNVNIVQGTNYKGAVLFTPDSGKGRPGLKTLDCCSLLIRNVAANHGYASSSCTCDKTAPDTKWHLYVSGDIFVNKGKGIPTH